LLNFKELIETGKQDYR